MSANPLADTQQAFDSVAADYDGPSGNNALIQKLRAQTMAAVTRHAAAGSRLVDLGCGTGLDAEYLARRGYHVTATDWSPEMVRRTQQRAAAAGLGDRLEVRHLGIQEIGELPAGAYDAAFSDLGPLNCVPDLDEAARGLAKVIRPGGRLIASVIGRTCPWELALFAARGNWARARLRFAPGPVPVPLNGHTVWTRYFSPGEFEAVFRRAGFQRIEQRGLGLFVPPPYMDAFAARHASLIAALARLEQTMGGWPVLRGWGDHFLIVMRKTA
jgi:2-polyprenyl-3-methyl-5-hydroxy-6-metoxy-1,4-benzoquinol methylase